MVKECSFLLLESTRRFHFAVFQNYFRVYCEVRPFIINCLFRMLSPYFWHRHTQVKIVLCIPSSLLWVNIFLPCSLYFPTLYLVSSSFSSSYLVPSIFIFSLLCGPSLYVLFPIVGLGFICVYFCLISLS